MRVVKAGTANVSVVVRIIDSTDGTPETGVVWNTAGIDLEYRREGAVSVDITEATLAALTTAHTDGGFLHIGNGYYRLDLPDAAVADGVAGVLIHGTVTGMVVIGEYIQLVDYDPFDGVRLGLTALPNAVADGAGGLPISDAGGLDLDNRMPAAGSITRMDLFYGADSCYASKYLGPRGPGVFYNDAASNTNTVPGTDGTFEVPVSTIAAAKTICDALSVDRIYLVNDSDATLAATMEDYEFVGIGEMTANTVNFGTQDVDNSAFHNLLLTGAQGGTGRCQAVGCALSSITGMEITALSCLIADGGSLTLRNDCAFDSCFSAVAGSGTPTLDINSVANVNVYFRHYSGGLQVNNAVATTVMSYESDGQLVIDATCTSLTVVPRGNLSITNNGTTTNIDPDAAMSRTGVRAAIGMASDNMDTQLGDIPTVAEFNARTLLAANYGTAANQTTIAAYLDTEVAAILEDTGTTIPALIAALNDLNAAGIRTALGMASADMDTQLSALSGFVDCLPATLDGATFTNLPDVTTDAASRTASKATGFAVAGDAMALTSDERNSLADVILGRSVATVEGTAAEWSLCTIVLGALESSINGTTWTIKRTDGSTTHATKTVTVDSAADPITGVA